MNDHLRQITIALELAPFDVAAAHQKMSVGGQMPQRPNDRSGQPRVGSVLLLFFPRHEVLHLVLTKRPDSLREHSGQISLPGGKQEAGESLQETALREAWEEIGVKREDVQIIGRLHTLYINHSDFIVHPFVGYIPYLPEFEPHPTEVAMLIETPLAHLLNHATRKLDRQTYANHTLLIPYFDLQGQRVWGATAIILSEFLERWRVSEYMEE